MKINFSSKSSEADSFVYRAVVVALVAAVAAVSVFILWRLSELFPTVFATILLAVGWRGAARSVSTRSGLSLGLSLALVALIFAAIVALAFSFFGGDLLRQYDEIAIDIPAAIEMLEGSVASHPWGQFVEKFIAGVDFTKASGPVALRLAAILHSFGSALAFAVFAIIGAAYLAADPQTHISGVLGLTPPSRRAQVARFIDSAGASLRQWLVIQLYVVVMNAVFAGVALWAFGVPAALALATISGALAFIPYFGSIVAIVVTALVALPHGLETAALAALAVSAASFLEGYLITPFLQSRSLRVAPAVLLFCMLAFGTLFGSMGVALAVPATVVLAVALDIFRGSDSQTNGAAVS
ncbi:MAG: AI-2E family transporter [Methylocystis sp.]